MITVCIHGASTPGHAIAYGNAIEYHETRNLVAPIVAHNVVNGAIMAATVLVAYVLT